MEKPVVMEADSQSDSKEVNLDELNIAEIRQQTTHILNALLETGECDIDVLFSMMKILLFHASNLMRTKEKYEDKVTEAEKKLKETMDSVNLVNKLFNSVKHPKVWDNFTIAQKKEIESWITEMQTSSHNCTKTSNDNSTNVYGDMDDVSEGKRIRLDRDNQSSMSNKMIKLLDEEKNLLHKLSAAKEEKEKLERKVLVQKSRLQELEADDSSKKFSPYENASAKIKSAKEMHLISLICVFLSAHQSGANIHYISSYLNQFDPTVEARDVEILMKNFPSVFNEKSFGIGAALEKKWQFCNFKST